MDREHRLAFEPPSGVSVNNSNGPAASPRQLSVPQVAREHYARNFIRQAVCELRFPTIFEIDDKRPPAAFWNAVRRVFQTHDLINKVNLGPAKVEHGSAHRFTSPKGRWTAVLRSSSVSLETSQYSSFEDFEQNLRVIVNAASQMIDSEFYTRIGLRYINLLPTGDEGVDGWVNPVLVAPLVTGVLGDSSEFAGQVRGNTACGGYYFQHGFGVDQAVNSSKGYVLDFDFYCDDVPVAKAWETIGVLHSEEHSLFRWALGSKAQAHLQKGA
jgi:uncharacterized protein (TIGR04255 family)